MWPNFLIWNPLESLEVYFKFCQIITICYSVGILLLNLISKMNGHGLLLLYRPRDISNECAFSHRLRYDISYGMGMSDTTTLVFRTLSEIDYECTVEIVTESDRVFIVVVIKYPNNVGTNCFVNRDAFTVMKKNRCLRLCDLLGDRDVQSPYFVVTVRGRFRFRFLSNSSINSDIQANLYQVTATSARKKPSSNCNRRNETLCAIDSDEFCFTSGVVCDGIKNCGVNDWFDERKSECGLPVERLGYAPVFGVVAAILCALLAAGHLLLRWLPLSANSFFIFNANEDNRLCIDPVFKSPGASTCVIEKAKRNSLIPVFSSSSSSNEVEEKGTILQESQELNKSKQPEENRVEEQQSCPRPKNTMRTVTSKIQQKFLSVTGRGRNASISSHPAQKEEV